MTTRAEFCGVMRWSASGSRIGALVTGRSPSYRRWNAITLPIEAASLRQTLVVCLSPTEGGPRPQPQDGPRGCTHRSNMQSLLSFGGTLRRAMAPRVMPQARERFAGLLLG